MKAVIVTDCYEQYKSRLEQTFDDYVVYEVVNDPQRYYEQAHCVAAQPYKPLFLFVANPTLAAIIVAQIMRRHKFIQDGKVRFHEFYVVEDTKTRLRVLKLP